jgi:hypothetical protein
MKCGLNLISALKLCQRPGTGPSVALFPKINPCYTVKRILHGACSPDDDLNREHARVPFSGSCRTRRGQRNCPPPSRVQIQSPYKSPRIHPLLGPSIATFLTAMLGEYLFSRGNSNTLLPQGICDFLVAVSYTTGERHPHSNDNYRLFATATPSPRIICGGRRPLFGW